MDLFASCRRPLFLPGWVVKAIPAGCERAFARAGQPELMRFCWQTEAVGPPQAHSAPAERHSPPKRTSRAIGRPLSHSNDASISLLRSWRLIWMGFLAWVELG